MVYLRKSMCLERKWKDILFQTIMNHIYRGQEHTELTIAKESHNLWLIIMKVDHQIDMECIVDPGSQIIAMSEAV